MIGLAIIIVLLVLLLPQALFIVPQQNVYIIERLGKFNRTVGAGLNIKIPFFETIAAKVDMRTRQEQFGIDAKTRDNVTVTMAIAAQYRVSAQPAANGQPSGVWRSYYMLAIEICHFIIHFLILNVLAMIEDIVERFNRSF